MASQPFTHEEAQDVERYGFTFREARRGTTDDGEQFVTVVQVFADGTTQTQEFAHREAFADAGYYVHYAYESAERHIEAERLGVHPLELELAPFGPAWEREQEERYGGGVPF